MCGIAGYLGEIPNSNNLLFEMINAVNHRGPDNHGIWFDENAGVRS